MIVGLKVKLVERFKVLFLMGFLLSSCAGEEDFESRRTTQDLDGVSLDNQENEDPNLLLSGELSINLDASFKPRFMQLEQKYGPKVVPAIMKLTRSVLQCARPREYRKLLNAVIEVSGPEVVPEVERILTSYKRRESIRNLGPGQKKAIMNHAKALSDQYQRQVLGTINRLSALYIFQAPSFVLERELKLAEERYGPETKKRFKSILMLLSTVSTYNRWRKACKKPIAGEPISCKVRPWNNPKTSCTGKVIATGSMNNSDSPKDAAKFCAESGKAGSCCMFHLYGKGQWYLTDGKLQETGRLCDEEGNNSCYAGGMCMSESKPSPERMTCEVGAWNNPKTSCTGKVLATGSMENSDSPKAAAKYCETSGKSGSCCMFHLYGKGQWYLTDGKAQKQGRLCDPEGNDDCYAGGNCYGKTAFAPLRCSVGPWNAPKSSCTGKVVASGSMDNNDSPKEAAKRCEASGAKGSCCMYHLYGEGKWYMTDGKKQQTGRLCDPEGNDDCYAGGNCSR